MPRYWKAGLRKIRIKLSYFISLHIVQSSIRMNFWTKMWRVMLWDEREQERPKSSKTTLLNTFLALKNALISYNHILWKAKSDTQLRVKYLMAGVIKIPLNPSSTICLMGNFKIWQKVWAIIRTFNTDHLSLWRYPIRAKWEDPITRIGCFER